MFANIAQAASTAAPHIGRAALAGGQAVAGLVAAKKLTDFSYAKVASVKDEVEDLVGEFRGEAVPEANVTPTQTQEQKAS